MTTTNDQPQFDADGVAKYIKDKAVFNWFRKKIVPHYKVPFEHQAKLALILLDEAVEHNKGHLTLPFLRNHRYEDYIPSLLEYEVTQVGEEIAEKIRLKAIEQQFQRELENFTRGLAIMFRSGRVIDRLLQQYPQTSLKVDNGSRRLIRNAKRIIDDLAEKLPPTSYWGKS
jgi:hypothetical protein